MRSHILPSGARINLRLPVCSVLPKLANARGLFENREKTLRIGHFGNVSPAEARSALNALEMSLKACGYHPKVGTAIEAAELHFLKLYNSF